MPAESDETIPIFDLALIAGASQSRQPTEEYEWGGKASGSGQLPQGNDWTIPGASIRFRPPLRTQRYRTVVGAISSRIPIEATYTGRDADASGGTVTFKYRWSDGAQADCERILAIHHPAEPNGQNLEEIIDADANGWGLIAWKDGSQYAHPADADKEARIGPQWSIIKKVAPFVAVPLALATDGMSALTVALVSEALDGSAEWATGQEEDHFVSRIATFMPGVEIIESNGSNMGFTYSEDYDWRVSTKPRLHVVPVVMDHWGTAGFIGRGIEEKTYNDGPLDVPRAAGCLRYHLWHKSTYAGGGAQ